MTQVHTDAGKVLSAEPTAAPAHPQPSATLMWIDHFSMLPGDPTVTTSCDAVSSGVGTGLTGLVIHSSTTGSTGTSGGNKVVQTALEIPPTFTLHGVRVCYELSNSRSFITQIRLAQVQDPPATASVLLDDPTQHTAIGPVCVDSASTSIDPVNGPILLDLRVNFGSPGDVIVVRGIALHVAPRA